MSQLLSDTELTLADAMRELGAAGKRQRAASLLSHRYALPVCDPLSSPRAVEPLQCPGYFFDFEALDDVACLDILVVLERHAAFVALIDLAHLLLEPLQSFERTLVDYDIIAQQPHSGAAADGAFRHHATCYLTNSCDIEDLADRSVSEEPLS